MSTTKTTASPFQIGATIQPLWADGTPMSSSATIEAVDEVKDTLTFRHDMSGIVTTKPLSYFAEKLAQRKIAIV